MHLSQKPPSSLKVLQRERVYNFLKSQPMATISTIDYQTGKPEAALIAFAELPSLELVFETFYDSRKYKNLQHNEAVALVIGWDAEKHQTLQYEGVAREVTVSDIPLYRKVLAQKDTPCSEEFLLHPKVRFFTVRPTWIAFSDYTKPHPRVIELTGKDLAERV